MAKIYSASNLSAFTFITPLFGIAAGYLIMNDPLTLAFGVVAFLLVAGLTTWTGRPKRPLIHC
jgi:drug/metabolite transporter (DMT)-like permease